MGIAEKLNTIADNEQLVYDAGKKAEYDAFWDVYMKPWQEGAYMFAGKAWNPTTYKPKVSSYKPVSNANFMYANTGITDTKIDLDLTHSSITAIVNMFQAAVSLVTIKKLILGDNLSSYSWFGSCRSLKNITIEGVINGHFVIPDSPLTLKSAKSIINALKDYSGTENRDKYKVTFKSEVITAIQNDLTSPNGNSWYDYIRDKGWLV